jgi:hypothetical protein
MHDEEAHMFAHPGGRSALRRASRKNPRNLPCPTCKRMVTQVVERRRYGGTTYTWLAVWLDGAWRDLGDPFPAVTPARRDVEAAVTALEPGSRCYEETFAFPPPEAV